MSMSAEDKQAIADFKARMARVAEANEDDFKVKFSVDETGVEIEVIETADRHIFLQGNGSTIQEAIDAALKDLPECCQQWGYRSVE